MDIVYDNKSRLIFNKAVMNNIEKAYHYFLMQDIDVTIDDGSLYILINDLEGHEVQLSQSEIHYRAELYDEEQKNTLALHHRFYAALTIKHL